MEYVIVVIEFNKNIKKHIREKRQYNKNDKKPKCNLLSQYTKKALRTKLEGMSDWARVSADQDGVGMLCMIRSVLHKNDESDVGMMSLVNANCALHTTHQLKKREIQCIPQTAPSRR